MGDEKIVQSDSDGSFMGIIVGILTLLVLVLLSGLIFAGLKLRERGFFEKDDRYYRDEDMDENMVSESEYNLSESG